MKTETEQISIEYYKDQLQRIDLSGKEFAPKIKIFDAGSGRDTNHFILNEQSARVLIEWLQTNFIKNV